MRGRERGEERRRSRVDAGLGVGNSGVQVRAARARELSTQKFVVRLCGAVEDGVKVASSEMDGGIDKVENEREDVGRVVEE